MIDAVTGKLPGFPTAGIGRLICVGLILAGIVGLKMVG